MFWELRNIYHHHPESKKRKSSEANCGSIHPYGRYEHAVKKLGKPYLYHGDSLACQGQRIEKRAATVEVDTLISPDVQVVTMKIVYLGLYSEKLLAQDGEPKQDLQKRLEKCMKEEISKFARTLNHKHVHVASYVGEPETECTVFIR